jgi:hypothetical protein
VTDLPLIYLIPYKQAPTIGQTILDNATRTKEVIYSIRVLTKIILRAVQGKAVTNKKYDKNNYIYAVPSF